MTTTSNYPSPEVLVAIMNNQRDLEIAQTQRWYRIPVKSADRFIPDLEQMQYLAFYQTQNFERDGCAVNYYAEIERISTARRIELLPDEAGDQKAEALYYKLEISPLQRLSQSIPSKPRRITFITTTLAKFWRAQEINDLFHTSPIEDLMWEALRAAEIQAERQYEIRERNANYDLDFAIECSDGTMVNIECNGATHDHEDAVRWDRRRNTLPNRPMAGWFCVLARTSFATTYAAASIKSENSLTNTEVPSIAVWRTTSTEMIQTHNWISLGPQTNQILQTKRAPLVSQPPLIMPNVPRPPSSV